MRSSAMRDLMAMTERPDVISLAGGLPDTSTFPKETFESMVGQVANVTLASALQYGPTEGLARTRECICEIMLAEGAQADPEDVIVTTGGQQAIDLVGKTFLDPGDVVVCEAPTYPGAVPVFSSYEAEMVQVPMDDDGLRTDLLEETLDRLRHEKRTPKFIYTVPSFHNPAGVTLSLERRRRIVEIAADREIVVLEDNPYGLVRFEGDPLPTLFELDEYGYVMYTGTFSKILAPGLRLGWLVAPPEIRAKANLGKQAVDLCTSPLTQQLVNKYVEDGLWRPYVASISRLYKARRDTMLAALEEFFPAKAQWTRPRGGLFVWATLPPIVDSEDLLAKALARNVTFVPGSAAYADGSGMSSMRLNFSGVGEDEITEGIRRIGAAIDELLSLYASLTGVSGEAEVQVPRRPASVEAEADNVIDLRRAGGHLGRRTK